MAYTVLDSKNIDKKKNIYTFGGSGTKPERDDIAENSKLIDYSSGEKFYYDPTKAAGSKWQPDKEPSGGSGGSLPANFPEEDAENANKFVGFDENGDYTAKDAPEEIPSITGKNGKVLGVTLDAQEHEQTEWVNPPASYPTITGKNGKVLGVTLNQDDEEQTEWIDPESPFFDVEFSYGAAGWAPNSATIAQILAAITAGKTPKAIVELGTGTYAYGFVCTSVNTQEQKAVAFSVNVSIEETVTNYVFSGIVDNGADTWETFEGRYLPYLSTGSVGDVVTLGEDDGTRFAAWSTPQ